MRVFWNSLQFKIPTVFIISFLLILAAIFGVFATIGKNLLDKQAYKQVILSGQNIVSELGNRIALAESLAIALANLGEELPTDDALVKRLAKHVIDLEGSETFIAGGGLWPEPYKYDPKIERHSFFWGRDQNSLLQYFDDYNNPSGPGYHHEEWYVPAKYTQNDRPFWSKSYMDPYSYQPMVTVTVPMFREKEFYGVSTIDLKLEGLHTFLEQITKSFGGYAFAVDRNGKFLSYPDENITKDYGIDTQGNRTEEFITIEALAKKQPAFVPYANTIQMTIEQLVTNAIKLNTYNENIANSIASESYQIENNEARLIAATLATSYKSTATSKLEYQQLFLEKDMLLGEPAYAAVFEMPKTYWKIVTVMPYSKAIEASNIIYKNLIYSILIVMFISLLIMLFFVRRILVSPIKQMSKQLKTLTQSDDSENKQLETSDKGELGNLVFWFNRRSQKLFEAQNLLRQNHELLEQRVTERTYELQQEIENRKKNQAIRESQVNRVEQQHSAIVDLSLHDSLFQGDIQLAAKIINKSSAKVINIERAGIWLFDDEHKHLKLVDLYDIKHGSHTNSLELKVKDYPSYFTALENDRSIAVSDALTDSRTKELKDYLQAYSISSLLDSPIRVGGKLRGVVCFEHIGDLREWHSDEIRFSGEIADQFIQVLTNAERMKSEDQIRQLAFYDPLTGLANRRLLQEAIQHELLVAKRHKQFGTLLYLDLDNFKTLNDSLGHAIGDELLIQLSERLKSAIRKDDIVSRLGGDEFVILLSGEYSTRHQAMDQALKVAQKIQLTINEPYKLHGYEHVITTSMGITIYPENNDVADDVLKQADAAMYRAKASGRNSICFYNPDMQIEADNRLLLEKELRTAITDNQFAMYYQPLVDYNGGVIGAEALIRWMHPSRGIVSPTEFIPIVEETGLILELGNWILHTACKFCISSNINHLAVNISPMQFRQNDFIESTTRILKQTGVNPESLVFELTERIVIENIDDTINKMNSLKKMGIRISIDDFGTGYSSLAYLKQLPIDQLKINNEFVRDINTDPNDAIIVDTIISMAKHLGLDVVAEGVETESQLEFLNKKGCHTFQGYYYSVPLPKDKFINYLARRQEMSL